MSPMKTDININVSARGLAVAGIGGGLLLLGLLRYRANKLAKSQPPPVVVNVFYYNIGIFAPVYNPPIEPAQPEPTPPIDTESPSLPQKSRQLTAWGKWAGKVVPFLASAKSLLGLG